MFKNFILILTLTFVVTKVSANDYFKALEFFNKKKTEESLIYFKKVAEDENHEKRSDAMFNIALIYDNGLGTQVDKTRALYYYEAASELSNKFALFNLGWIYYNGENVNKEKINNRGLRLPCPNSRLTSLSRNSIVKQLAKIGKTNLPKINNSLNAGAWLVKVMYIL